MADNGDEKDRQGQGNNFNWLKRVRELQLSNSSADELRRGKHGNSIMRDTQDSEVRNPVTVSLFNPSARKDTLKGN